MKTIQNEYKKILKKISKGWSPLRIGLCSLLNINYFFYIFIPLGQGDLYG